jgi:hypothetical protein
MMKEITPGFRVLTDFRWLDWMESAATAHLAEIMDALAEKEVAAVGSGSSRSTQRHWLKYSLAISLRPANQACYLRVVSGSIVSVDRRSGVRWLRRASPYQSWSVSANLVGRDYVEARAIRAQPFGIGILPMFPQTIGGKPIATAEGSRNRDRNFPKPKSCSRCREDHA